MEAVVHRGCFIQCQEASLTAERKDGGWPLCTVRTTKFHALTDPRGAPGADVIEQLANRDILHW